ncbi:MAG TPA: TonB C-terminal domain-containing protein [Gemmatimonadaceae bacterium]|nr:TonB C-terminal domain-containing protein [Gemmatimonadaceae bacterium]
MKAGRAADTVQAEARVRRPLSARAAAVWSVSGHIALIGAAFMMTRLTLPAPRPPAYSVELVAAPPGPRAVGAVQRGPAAAPTPAPEPVAPPPVPPTPEPAMVAAPKRPVAAVKPAVKKSAVAPRAATPTGKTPAIPPRASAPKAGADVTVPGKAPAGGGPTGGRGADVASVKVQGIAFPFPGYLENITRQIALNFKPRPGAVLRAEVTFLIHRDGSVSDLRLVSRSGVYAFDLECMGAVEAVGQRRSFGALPAGFRDDVLPVVFSFDPTVLR